MEDWDEVEAVRAVDREDMLGVVASLPEQIEYWLQRREEVEEVARRLRSPIEVLVTGMGGSGAAGDLLEKLFEDEVKVPILVNKDYEPPASVRSGTLLIAISYSGNTEETLSTYLLARRRGAQAVCIASGGQLSLYAQQRGDPCFQVPGGLQPRASIGYQWTPAALLLHELRLLRSDLPTALQETAEVLRRQNEALGPQVPEAQNPAKQLARALQGKVPLIYGCYGPFAAVAKRAKNMFNENSKIQAFGDVFPELNHNTLQGWEGAPSQNASFAILLLRDPEEPPRIHQRVELSKAIFQQYATVHEVWAPDHPSPVVRAFAVAHQLDFVSVYLAILNGVDPTPVPLIQELKRHLGDWNGHA